MHNEKKGGSGPTVGIVIIVLLMLVGALHFWSTTLQSRIDQPPTSSLPY